MTVDFQDLFDGTWFQQGWRDSFLHAQDDTMRCLDTNGSGSELDQADSYWHGPLYLSLSLYLSLCRSFTTLTLMASMAYSTWNNRPSGENVFTPRSYSERVKNMSMDWMNNEGKVQRRIEWKDWIWRTTRRKRSTEGNFENPKVSQPTRLVKWQVKRQRKHAKIGKISQCKFMSRMKVCWVMGSVLEINDEHCNILKY